MATELIAKSPLAGKIFVLTGTLSSLFTGSAGQGESNTRRWILENDRLEAIVALPLSIFYNTGTATYVWVLTNRKPEQRRGKVQLIDASAWFQPLRKNLGKKNCEPGAQDIATICRTFLDFQETEQSRICHNAAFGYWKVTVERPLRLAVDWSEERREPFFNACIGAGKAPLADAGQDVLDQLGARPHRDFNGFLDAVKVEMQHCGIKMTARRKTLLQTRLAQRDERAEPMVKKVVRRATPADPIHGLFAVGPGGQVGWSTSPIASCGIRSRFPCRKRAALKASCNGRCSPTRRMHGLLPRA